MRRGADFLGLREAEDGGGTTAGFSQPLVMHGQCPWFFRPPRRQGDALRATLLASVLHPRRPQPSIHHGNVEFGESVIYMELFAKRNSRYKSVQGVRGVPDLSARIGQLLENGRRRLRSRELRLPGTHLPKSTTRYERLLHPVETQNIASLPPPLNPKP